MKTLLTAFALLLSSTGYASLIEVEQPKKTIPLIVTERSTAESPELGIPVRVDRHNEDGTSVVRAASVDPNTHEISGYSEPFIVDTYFIAELNYREDFKSITGGLGLLLVTHSGTDFNGEQGIMLRLGVAQNGWYTSAGFGSMGILGAEIAAEYAYDSDQRQSRVGLISRFQFTFFQGILGLHYELNTHQINPFMGVGMYVPIGLLTSMWE